MSNPASDAASESRPQVNGAASAGPAGPSDGQATQAGKPASSRAEEVVDNLAIQAAFVTAYVGKGLLRLAARLGEELADIWAEAQEIRRGEK
jgi:hypothetical protein